MRPRTFFLFASAAPLTFVAACAQNSVNPSGPQSGPSYGGGTPQSYTELDRNRDGIITADEVPAL